MKLTYYISNKKKKDYFILLGIKKLRDLVYWIKIFKNFKYYYSK